MDGIEIGTGKQEEEREDRSSPAELVFFMAGVFGLLLFLHSLDGVRIHALAIYPFAGLLGGALWLSWNRKRRLFYLLLSVMLPAGVLYAYLLRDTLRLQLGGLLDRFALQTGGEPTDITQTAVLAAAVPVLLQQDALYGLVYGVEGYVTRTFRNVTGLAQEANADGRVSRGNNYRTGTAQLVLQTDIQPTATLYLKGFEGGEYTGGNWIRSNDEALFERMEERLDWGEWSYMIGGMYYSMYYVMNDGVYVEDAPLPRALWITHAGGSYYNTYAPYYNQRGAGPLFPDAEEEGYAFRYYEQQDMHVGEGEVPESFAMQMEWYQEIQDAYVKEAQTAYTCVPAELLPRLTALVKENPMESLEEITAFILYTLQSNTTYTLTPGRAPVNEDVVEYFLFEGKRGYCVHYSAAATLMYRLYGIPARYVSGYAVPPSAFRQTAEGTWRAEATDEQAHAWVEIFLEDYGWTPVEVTPSDSGAISAAYPGFAPEQMDALLAERGWNMEIPSLAKEEAGEAGTTAAAGAPEREAPGERISSFFQERRELLAAAVACAVYTVLMLPVFLDYRRLRIRKRMEKAGCR